MERCGFGSYRNRDQNESNYRDLLSNHDNHNTHVNHCRQSLARKFSSKSQITHKMIEDEKALLNSERNRIETKPDDLNVLRREVNISKLRTLLDAHSGSGGGYGGVSSVAWSHHHRWAEEHRTSRLLQSISNDLKYFHRPRLQFRHAASYTVTVEIPTLKDIPLKTMKNGSKSESTAIVVAGGTNAKGFDQNKLIAMKPDDHTALDEGFDNLIVIEYVEEFPPIMMNPGMRSAIVNYYRLLADQLKDIDDADDGDINDHSFNNSISGRSSENIVKRIGDGSSNQERYLKKMVDALNKKKSNARQLKKRKSLSELMHPKKKADELARDEEQSFEMDVEDHERPTNEDDDGTNDNEEDDAQQREVTAVTTANMVAVENIGSSNHSARTAKKADYILPTHAQLLWKLKRCRRPYHYDFNIPHFHLGTMKILYPNRDPSPFLGEIPAGSVQPALVNNLFRAPLFPHHIDSKNNQSCDFLLVVKQKNKIDKTMTCWLREMPFRFLAGQSEPLMIVPRRSAFTIAELEKEKDLKKKIAATEKLFPVEFAATRLAIVRFLKYFSIDSNNSEDGVDLDTMLKFFFGSVESGQQLDIQYDPSDTGLHMLSTHQVLQRMYFKYFLEALADEYKQPDGSSRYFIKKIATDEEPSTTTGSDNAAGRGNSGRGGRGGRGSGGRTTGRGGRGGRGDNNGRGKLVKSKGPDYIKPLEYYSSRFTPEELCLEQSYQAAEHRLFSQGIFHDLDIWIVAKYMKALHKRVECKKQMIKELKETDFYKSYLRYVTNAKNTLTVKEAQSLPHVPPLLIILSRELKKLQDEQEIARNAFRGLVNAPWNTTANFVNAVINCDEHGYLELKQHADPSGRGEGFAFFRLRDIKDPFASKEESKEVEDDDMRSLGLPELHSYLEAFGMKKQDIKPLGRWEKVRRLQRFCTEAFLQNTLDPKLEKFVRLESNERQLYDKYKKDCQAIWTSQFAALSSTERPSSNVCGSSNTPDSSGTDEEDPFMIMLRDMMDDNKQLFGANKEELKTLYFNMMQKDTRKCKGLGIVGNSAPPILKSNLVTQWPSNRPRPMNVLRKIKRTRYTDGTERIEIKFVLQ